MTNKGKGGRYIKATDGEAIFVSGTNREQTPAEKKAVDKILNRKPPSASTRSESATE